MNCEAEIARKTRTLKKYEAEPIVARVDPASPPIALLSPFGPWIARSQAPVALLERLNAFADPVTKPNEGSEFLVPAAVAEEGGAGSLVSFLHDQLRRYVEATERVAVTQIEIDVIWIVSQAAGTPSPVHFHSGDLSGVLYLKAPDEAPASELAKTYISGRQAGYLNFITGGKARFSTSLLSVPPDVGTIYVFPGWLLHGAEPFVGSGERRSLSFNARISVKD